MKPMKLKEKIYKSIEVIDKTIISPSFFVSGFIWRIFLVYAVAIALRIKDIEIDFVFKIPASIFLFAPIYSEVYRLIMYDLRHRNN